MGEKVWIEVLSDFHCLLFLYESGLVDDESMALVLRAVKSRVEEDIQKAISSGGWKTVMAVLDEQGVDVPSGSGLNDSPWSCRHCTFHNLSGENCEMCSLPRD